MKRHALIEAFPAKHRDAAEFILYVLEQAPKGNVVAMRQFERLAATLALAPQLNQQRLRFGVLRMLKGREWNVGDGIGVALNTPLGLGRFDLRFLKLSRRDFEVACECEHRTLAKLAAHLSCKVRAFGDRNKDNAFEAFEEAQRVFSKTFKSRRKS